MEPLRTISPTMAEGSLFQGRQRIAARAWYVGDRIDVRRIEQGDSLALSPLTIRAGRSGCAMIFRNGVLVLFGLWTARGHLKAVFGSLFGRRSDGSGRAQCIDYHGRDADSSVRSRAAKRSIADHCRPSH